MMLGLLRILFVPLLCVNWTLGPCNKKTKKTKKKNGVRFLKPAARGAAAHPEPGTLDGIFKVYARLAAHEGPAEGRVEREFSIQAQTPK